MIARWFGFWLGVLRIEPWPCGRDCDHKARWIAVVDPGGYDHWRVGRCRSKSAPERSACS